MKSDLEKTHDEQIERVAVLVYEYDFPKDRELPYQELKHKALHRYHNCPLTQKVVRDLVSLNLYGHETNHNSIEVVKEILTNRDLPVGQFPLGACPRCKKLIHLWFQQNKATGTVLGKVSHTETNSSRCHGMNKDNHKG